MRTCADSVTAANLPPGLPLYAAYVNGIYRNYGAVKAQNPTATVIGITVFNQNVGDCFDVEFQDGIPAQAPGWTTQRRDSGHAGPLTYCSEEPYQKDGIWYGWEPTREQYAKQNVSEPDWWIAGYPGSVGPNLLYAGAVGHQFVDLGTYDMSVFVDYLPGIDPMPVPDIFKETEMLARNTAGRGYWAARPQGNVYAYGGAPFLGPAQHFLTEWGIGTPDNPVVGIADDGAGGFVLEADKGLFPGAPALYQITADGKYRD